MDDFYTKEELSNNEVIFNMDIPADSIAQIYNRLLEDQTKNLKIKGFREGKVPTGMVEPQLEKLLLNDAFEQIAPYYVNAAIIKEKLEPIAPPEYSDITELSKEKGAKFKVKVTLSPTFAVPDIKKLKIKQEIAKVTDEEITQTLENMRDNNVASLKGAKKPEINDEWAKEIAEKYGFSDIKNLKSLKDQIEELIMRQKQQIIDQSLADNAMRKVIEAAGFEVPDAAVKYEAQQREEAFMQDIKSSDVSLRDFLKERELTMEQLKEMWEKDSREALGNDIFLRAYAKEKKIELTDEEMNKEIENLKQSAKAHYEMEHAGHDHPSHFDETVYDDPSWREQISTYILKQKAYQELMNELIEPVEQTKSKKVLVDDKGAELTEKKSDKGTDTKEKKRSKK